MSNVKTEVLSKIKSKLNEKWALQSQSEINIAIKKIEASQQTPVQKEIAISRVTKQLKDEYNTKFCACWDACIGAQIANQYDIIYAETENLLLNRHPWLRSEGISTQSRLMDVFLSENIQELLFKLLKDKPRFASDWDDMQVSETSTFAWDDLAAFPKIKDGLKYKIEGYPLSNSKFYDDRVLSSFLLSPFTMSPSRYDIYRLLKSTYQDKFKPQKLTNNIYCTKIAPLHIDELSSLEPCEWAHLDSIILNIGTEDEPEWVLLDKKNGNWSLYTNDSLLEKFQEQSSGIQALANINICNIAHVNCKNPEDWHAVLLSRVLPWTQINQANKPTLENFRNNIPVELLLQNTIEESCLSAQKAYINKARQAFASYYPLSEKTIMELYQGENITQLLFPSITTPDAKNIIEAFEQNKISYNGTQITINDAKQLIEAMKIAYHLGITELSINDAPSKSDKSWFTYNLELTTIHSPDAPNYGFIHACAARNRFIHNHKPSYLRTGDEMFNRKHAWENTGKFIYEFFKQDEEPDLLQLRNIAEMGKDGLDNFFAYLNTLDKAPNLSCTFDLNSGKSITPDQYIAELQNQIDNFKQSKLFNSLELILPDTFDNLSQNNFFKLLKTLNIRNELTFVTFKNANGLTKNFLKELNNFLAANKICLQIIIPEWDIETFDKNIEKGDLKAQYREVQNTILSNIRDKRQENLNANTETISKPEDVIKLKSKTGIKLDSQKWRANTQYQLASASVGVQQQAQQEVAQEAQQKENNQSKPQTPTKREIKNYSQKSQLITRQNLMGINEQDFSMWVGSNKNAPHIIQKIDEHALAQIQKFPDIFKFGVDPDRTPGFRLFYTSEDDKSLILSFDETLVEQDLLDLKDDPFAVKMNNCKEATPFYGDFRQFEEITLFDQETCWHHLSEEKDIPQKVQNWIITNDKDSQTSEALQLYNCIHQIKYAKDQADMLKIIKTWSTIKDENFLKALIDNFNPKNLKAFGQLFYHYSETGNQKWLELTYQIYQRFPDKFSIFKERLLDTLNDWSECLEQSEVKALTASIKKLEDQPIYANILWNLVDKHGESVGRMRFAEVWRAYEKVIDYINANDLDINETEFLDTIKKYATNNEFNATQFLRRIYEVLQATSNRQDSDVVQKEILNNLSKIDWHENGFYYACINEGYRYWDIDLKLNGTPSYVSVFDSVDLSTITDTNTYALRYAAQHLKLNKADFLEFKKILKKIPSGDINLIRLVLASLTLGIDSIKDLEHFDFAQFNTITDVNAYNTINSCLLLDPKDLKAGSYHVSLADLPILLKVISANNLKNLDLKTINSLGRALQSYTGLDKEQKLNSLIKSSSFDSPLFNAFPWLVDDPISNPPTETEHLRFYEQLQTINFKTSRLPNKATLERMLSTIHSKEDRQNAIKELLDCGCNIADQDAEHRLLNPDEKKLVDGLFLSKTFKARNIELLKQLFEHLAVKEGEDAKNNLSAFLNFCSELDRKNYYNELGQLLGLLIEKSQGNKCYAVKQLTTWLSSIFDQEAFQNNPYPVTFIKELLIDALKDGNSSLLNNNLHHLKTEEPTLASLQIILSEINLIDLRFQAKETLVKFAIKFKLDDSLNHKHIRIANIFKQFKDSEPVITACSIYINKQLDKSPTEFLAKLPTLEKLTLPCPYNDKALQALWEENQIRLFEELTAGTIEIDIIEALVNTKDQFTRMILISAFDAKNDTNALIEKIKTSLSHLNETDKQELAKYYATDPKPKLKDLEVLLTKANKATQIINHFEMVMQPMGKRDYSLNEKDATDILRVLNGIKLKGQPGGIAQSEQAELLRLLYHCNNYCQAIKLNEKSYDDILEIIFTNRDLKTPEAKARILACIREVIVRKTGKWINHTQMLDLIYSALHNDDSLLHQIHMGEGKSIIGLARDVYLAMHGEIIDVYSSKESLSSRDHLDSVAVLDAFGIRHSHIHAKSEPDEYHNNLDGKGVGAVHYATIGNWSLFYSGVRWENKDKTNKINVYKAKRRARCDEGDYVMRSENTLFNYSDQDDSQAIYNYDAWVYQIAYDFYMERQNKFAKNDFTVSEDEDLQELYNRIAAGQTTIAPDKSTFFQTYLATGDDNIRNNKLTGLLTAAHLAQKLKNGVDFCVMNEQKMISKTSCIDIRFAKVMINNQVYHGSTYSDLVQQFLHVRLNNEAIKNHETPNFFIEPESEIALSANSKFILQNYYTHLEAMTGTAGDKEAVNFYRDVFGVLRVIKMPTHEEIKTTFLPPIYTSTAISAEISDAIDKLQNPGALENAEKISYTTLIEEYIDEGRNLQVEEIIKAINLDPSQPVLITCEDDREVAALGALVLQALANHEPKVVIDTNASGLSEADILKDAGQRGAITISSRLGRGSDIVPYERKSGLKVLRTYPATPEVVKQEEGRQGRHGAGGTCQDIINYNAVAVQLHIFEEDVNFKERFKYETLHLEEKIQKHNRLENDGNKSKPKWQAIKTDTTLREKYLKARTLEYIKQKYKNEAKERLAQKDNILIEGSANVMEKLFGLSIEEQDALKRAWKQCRRNIEAHWQDDDECLCAQNILDTFYIKNNIKPFQSVKNAKGPSIVESSLDNEPEKTRELIAFHQTWLNDLFLNGTSQDIISTIYGKDCKRIDDLYHAFHMLNCEELKALSMLVAKNQIICHKITCDAWVQAVRFLVNDSVNLASNLERIQTFFSKNSSVPNSVEGIKEYSQKFIVAVEGAPDIDFILDLADEFGDDALNDIVKRFGKEVVYLCKNCMNEEDINFFLNTLRKAHSPDRILNYLKDNFNDLKLNRAIIRPILPILSQEKTFEFMRFDFDDPTIPGLLQVLSKRPDFEEKEFNKFRDKIARIKNPDNQMHFLAMLSTIPPFVSIKTILKDLIELPGMCFEDNYQDLVRRIQKMQNCATIFNEFLFKNDIIKSMDPRDKITDKDAFKAWQDVYFSMPLENREIFFMEIAKVNNVGLDKLKRLAISYTEDSSNLILTEKIISLLQNNKKSDANEENKSAASQTQNSSFFTPFGKKN